MRSGKATSDVLRSVLPHHYRFALEGIVNRTADEKINAETPELQRSEGTRNMNELMQRSFRSRVNTVLSTYAILAYIPPYGI